MDENADGAAPLSERNVSAAIVVLSVLLVLLLVLPYLKYVLLAVVLAYVLAPVERTIERWLGPTGATLLAIVLAVTAIILPVVYVLAVAIEEAIEFATAVEEGTLSPAALEERLAAAGYPVDANTLYGTYREPVATALQGAATGTLDIVGGVFDIVLGLTVTVFVLYGLLHDGDRLLAWIRDLLPLENDLQRELLAEYDRLMWASVVGNAAIALVQAILLGIGVVLAGLPGTVLIVVVTFVVALLPVVGVVAVWLPLGLYLLTAGRPVAAALMVAYGLAISVTDNYLRAVVIGRGSELDAATVIVGIFGGVVLFGIVGLFVGPVVLGGAKVTIETVLRERSAGEGGTT